MPKNNQKREKAIRNKENARKYRKKTTGRKGPGRPGGTSQGSANS